MHIHLINPSHVSFGVAVITPRWLFVLAAATPSEYGDPLITDETLEQFDPSTHRRRATWSASAFTRATRSEATRSDSIARERGAWVVYGGIHATLYPDEALDLGGGHAIVKGDGDIAWGQAIKGCLNGESTARVYEGGKIDAEHFLQGAVGSAAARSLHVGVGADRSRLPEALLVLFRLEDRRAGAASARRRCRGRRKSSSCGAAASASSRSPTTTSTRSRSKISSRPHAVPIIIASTS